jgi:LmbE family N-acetylglucosaminyl deacetylase
MFGKRILILAAHPDDEVVACAGTIGRAQAEGAAIFTLYLTHGCIARDVMLAWQRKHYETRVARRRKEGEDAAKLLGVMPVGWASRPARHLWRELEAVYGEIEAAVAQYAIDQLWVPAYEGGNADHDALNALGSLFASNEHRKDSLPLVGRVRVGGAQQGQSTEMEGQSSRNSPPPTDPFGHRTFGRFDPHKGGGIPPVLEFAEYNFAGGKAHSQAFPKPNGTEQLVSLTPAEQQRKRAVLAIYGSENLNLNYVKTIRECFRPLAAYDYSRPPHEGVLWYAKFQWIPFRHPRVDFTKPEEVSGAIVRMLAS